MLLNRFEMRFGSINISNYNQIANIYNAGIATGIATFEVEAPDFNIWDKNHLPFGRITIEDNETVLGWASLAKVSDRCAYNGVAEVSVYVHPQCHRQHIGTKLLNHLIKISEENGIWTLQCGIMEENIASIKLHQDCGFRIIGYREKVGCLNGIWKNNTIMERRSKIVGI